MQSLVSSEKSAVLFHGDYKQKILVNSNKTYIIRKFKENAVNMGLFVCLTYQVAAKLCIVMPKIVFNICDVGRMRSDEFFLEHTVCTMYYIIPYSINFTRAFYLTFAFHTKLAKRFNLPLSNYMLL